MKCNSCLQNKGDDFFYNNGSYKCISCTREKNTIKHQETELNILLENIFKKHPMSRADFRHLYKTKGILSENILNKAIRGIPFNIHKYHELLRFCKNFNIKDLYK